MGTLPGFQQLAGGLTAVGVGWQLLVHQGAQHPLDDWEVLLGGDADLRQAVDAQPRAHRVLSAAGVPYGIPKLVTIKHGHM